MKLFRFLPLLLLAACGSHLSAPSEERQKAQIALEEMRQEVADMRHLLSANRMELQLLEERARAQETGMSSLKKDTLDARRDVGSRTQVETLDQRLKDMKGTQEKLIADVKQLSSHLQTVRERIDSVQQEVHSHEERLAKVGELRKTLTKMAQSGGTSSSSYVVKSGDTLEKIARAHGTTVEEIKRINTRKNDQIRVGEELLLPQ